MAVAVQPTKQVEELLKSMEIGAESKSTYACEMPAIDRNNSVASGSVLPSSEDTNTMDNEGEQDLLVEQGLYYPASNYYGYYCTGYEPPGVEWDANGRFVGVDGQEIQYPGLHPESVPLVYYAPGYGYPQPAFNPYNPYIPGAVLGVDGQYIGHQPYYTGPMYQHPVSSPGYYPPSLQSGSEALPTSSSESGLLVADAVTTSGINVSTTATMPRPGHSAAFMPTHVPFSRDMQSVGMATSSAQESKSLARSGEGQRRPAVSAGQQIPQGIMTSTSLPYQSFRHMNQNLQLNQQQGSSIQGPVQAKGYLPFGKVPPSANQGKATLPLINNFTDLKLNERGYVGADRLKQRGQINVNLTNGNGNLDVLSEQNRGPRTNRTRNQWISPAVHNAGTDEVVGNVEGDNPAGHIVQYNRDDFDINCDDARFFVIKSYSEDDVHKSIKYSVWSSTPNGNKRLDGAYQDAQERSGGKPGGCPVFLFFSVNASGQFCGVAEMVGPVNFKSNKDFWQQDKWSGCFPVKWHIIKDVSNSHLRHIILENNENKPVTNSRDTQEVKYAQGMEMLNIFKNYSWKTSILDDFDYYEDREKAMQDKKSRQHAKQQQQLQPAARVGPHIQSKKSDEEFSKLDGEVGRPSDLKASDRSLPLSCVNGGPRSESISTKQTISGSIVRMKDETVSLKVVDSKKDDPKGVSCDGESVLTVGTMAIDSRGVNYDSPCVLTVGTMAIDTRVCDPRILTVGTMPIDTNAVDSDFPGGLRVGTVFIDQNKGNRDSQSISTVGTVSV